MGRFGPQWAKKSQIGPRRNIVDNFPTKANKCYHAQTRPWVLMILPRAQWFCKAFAPCQQKEKVCKNDASCRFRVPKRVSNRIEIGNFERKLLRFKFKPNTFPSLGENQWLLHEAPTGPQ